MKKGTSIRSWWGRDTLMALLTLLIIAGAALYAVVSSVTLYGAVPDPVPASAPPTQFSSGRALEHIRAIAKEPHPMGSPENAAVRDYLVKERGAMGLEPEVQRATAVALKAPDVDLLGDDARGGVRRLRMRVSAPAKANLLVVGTGTRVVGVKIDGKRVSDESLHDGGIPVWTLNYWNPPLQGIKLALEVKGTEPLTITARTGTPGLPTIPGKTYRDRPPDTMPKSRNSITAEQDSSTVVSKSFTFATHPEHKESS